MKIIDILNKKNMSLSFEVFPPKVESSFDSVKTATEEIGGIPPYFMSVTYGAGGGISNYTIDIAKNLMHKYNVPLLAHLTCVSSSKEFVSARIQDMKEAGIENVMALRGDLTPELEKTDRNTWDYKYASELIVDIKEQAPDFCIGAACYPEGHIECAHKEDDIANLKIKVDAGVDFLTTQMFFDNNVLYNFLYRIRERGITVPVIAGIMPITNAKQIAHVTELSGTYVPTRFKAIVDKFGDNPAAMKQAGIAYATEQIIDLVANGVRAIHIYTMNKPDVAESIRRNLSHIIGDEQR